jgi:hypothetical protein
MRIGTKFEAASWPALRIRLAADDEEAWRQAVDLLRERIGTRYLDHSAELLKRRYSGFAVLAIDCAVVEALEQFRRGEKKTPWSKGGDFFQSFLTQTSLGKYFTAETANLFYKTIRCGILHQAETTEDTLIKKNSKQFVVQLSSSGKGLVINAARFHDELNLAFDEYANALRDGDRTLRELFLKKMDHIARLATESLPVGQTK